MPPDPASRTAGVSRASSANGVPTARGMESRACRSVVSARPRELGGAVAPVSESRSSSWSWSSLRRWSHPTRSPRRASGSWRTDRRSRSARGTGARSEPPGPRPTISTFGASPAGTRGLRAFPPRCRRPAGREDVQRRHAPDRLGGRLRAEDGATHERAALPAQLQVHDPGHAGHAPAGHRSAAHQRHGRRDLAGDLGRRVHRYESRRGEVERREQLELRIQQRRGRVLQDGERHRGRRNAPPDRQAADRHELWAEPGWWQRVLLHLGSRHDARGVRRVEDEVQAGLRRGAHARAPRQHLLARVLVGGPGRRLGAGLARVRRDRRLRDLRIPSRRQREQLPQERG